MARPLTNQNDVGWSTTFPSKRRYFILFLCKRGASWRSCPSNCATDILKHWNSSSWIVALNSPISSYCMSAFKDLKEKHSGSRYFNSWSVGAVDVDQGSFGDVLTLLFVPLKCPSRTNKAFELKPSWNVTSRRHVTVLSVSVSSSAGLFWDRGPAEQQRTAGNASDLFIFLPTHERVRLARPWTASTNCCVFPEGVSRMCWL